MFYGEKLSSLRKLNGLSRKELADKLNITEQAVWQYENKALGFGRCSLIIGIIDVIWMFVNYYMLMGEFY